MDQPTVETPVVEDAHFVEHVPPRSAPLVDVGPPRFGNPFVYAVERSFAALLDLAVPAFAVTATLYGLVAINPLTGLPTNSLAGFAIALAIGLAVALVAIVAGQGMFGGTLGKLAVGLHVQRVGGGKLSPARAIVRTLLLPLDALAIGFLMALLPGHRRLGDLAAQTVVVRLRRQSLAIAGWIGLAVICAVPFALVGPVHAFAAIFAFFEFVPRLIGGGLHAVGLR